MKALVKKEAQKGIWMEKVAVPKVGVNDVLIKIKKTAICGTDLHIYKWDEWSQKTIKTPMTIGHEYVGIVAEVGPGVRNIQVGDRVTGYTVAHLDITNTRAYFCNNTHILMTDGHRSLDSLLAPFIPLVDVQVGTTNGSLLDLDEDVVYTHFWNGNFFHPNPLLGFLLN